MNKADTGHIGHTRHSTETTKANKKHNRMSNTYPIRKPGVNPGARNT